MRGASAVVAVVVGLAILPACSGDDGRVAATGELGPPESRLVSCGNTPYPASALHGPTGAESADTPVAAAFRRALAEGGGEVMPSSGWRLLLDEPPVAVFGAGEPADAREGEGWLTEVVLRDEGEGLEYRSSSHGCEPNVHVAGLVEFTVAPETDLDPSTRTVPVLVGELACTSGQPIDDRLQPPRVRYGPDSVEVLFTAEPLRGSFGCPGIAPEPATLELDEPLGDRQLLDASVYPPRDATTPL